MKNAFFYDTSIGRIGIVENNNTITNVNIHKDIEFKNVEIKETPLIKETYKQLQEYFEGNRNDFDLPLAPEGTEFQQRVWKALQSIPYGKTMSYKEIAEKIGSPKAARAIGMANNKNPIFIIIPCHRVIGSNGKLVGYGGGLDLKERLLNIEKEN